jgi:hypothetical protein
MARRRSCVSLNAATRTLSAEFSAMGISVSEIEFCTLYVVAGLWILGCILRLMHAKKHYSDTLVCCRRISFPAMLWFA